MRATSVIAEFIVKSRWEDCPVAAVDAARRAILDCVGVMLAGSAEPAARIVQQIAESEGGAPLATIVGTRRRTGAVWAALANGTAAHALDFDDTNFAMLGHPSAPVLSAALAAGELALADGRALVHAFLLGFEVETTLAEVINPAHYEKGFHATGTLGAIGAAAAASRLLGLDGAQTRTALAIAATQASGLKENFGTMTKPFHAGHAARSGVLSALLAREGFTASEQAIEGPQGYLAVLSAGKREESALELQRTLRVAPDDIARVTIGVHPTVPRILIHSHPKSGLEAKFSGEFSAAAALCEGKVGMQTFQDDKAQDPAIRELMKRTRMVVDPEIPSELERHMWTRVTLQLRDGREVALGPRPVPGHPSHPLTIDQLREKFRDCARLVLAEDRVDSVRQMVETLDGCPDLRSLTAILSPTT